MFDTVTRALGSWGPCILSMHGLSSCAVIDNLAAVFDACRGSEEERSGKRRKANIPGHCTYCSNVCRDKYGTQAVCLCTAEAKDTRSRRCSQTDCEMSLLSIVGLPASSHAPWV